MTLLPKPFRDLLLGSLLTFCLCCSPYQGSRTIRTEEAVLITLARFSSVLFPSASKDTSTTTATGKKLRASEENQKPTPDNTPVTFTDDSVSDESSSDDDSDGSSES